MARPRLLRLLLLLGASSCAADPAEEGRILYVTPPVGGEWDDPDVMPLAAAMTFTTIQDAIDSAVSGDTVAVPAGTYIEDIDMASGIAVVGAGSDETLIVGTVTFSGLTGASLSKVGLYDATFVGSGVAYVETGITVDGGDADFPGRGAPAGPKVALQNAASRAIDQQLPSNSGHGRNAGLPGYPVMGRVGLG